MAAPQWGPGPRPYAPPPPPPPGRRRGGGALAGLAIALGMGAVALGIVFVALLAAGPDREPAAGGGIASGTPTAPVPSPEAPPGGPASASPGPGGTGASGGGTAAVNRIYQAGALPVTGCKGRPITSGDPKSMESFLNATTDCLDRSWGPTLSRNGIRFAPPRRVFWTAPGRSPCGDYPASGAAAFYCALNNSIYIGVVHVQEAAGGMPVKWNVAYARGVAHEYAHHVQETSGILQWSREQRVAATGSAERDAITRRSELQAQCFAGIFMSSVRASFPVTSAQWRVTLRDSYGRGDGGGSRGPRDHGSNEHYVSWLREGYRRNSTAVCNTWTAPAGKVS